LFNVSALRMACTAHTARARSDVLVWALIASFVLGGPSVPFLKASVYQEAILWEGVFASAFLVLALHGLTAPDGFSPRTLLLMAIAAGCCLPTRVVMATGLYAATLAPRMAVRSEMSRCYGETAGPIRSGLHAGFRLLSTPRFMVPLMGLALFASAAGFINHKRFGNPLVFHNPTLQTIVRPHGVPALERYGEFNPRRIPYALMYYFAPVWFIHSDDGDLRFNDYRRRELDLAEPPPSSFFVSDPLLLVLAAAGFSALLQGDRVALSRPAAAAIAAALAVPTVLMLMAFVMAFRYRMEFYPLLVFLAVIGAFGTKPEIAAPRPRSATDWSCSCFGIVPTSFLAPSSSPLGNLDPSRDLLQIYQMGCIFWPIGYSSLLSEAKRWSDLAEVFASSCSGERLSLDIVTPDPPVKETEQFRYLALGMICSRHFGPLSVIIGDASVFGDLQTGIVGICFERRGEGEPCP
jgi:hypothetical protein